MPSSRPLSRFTTLILRPSQPSLHRPLSTSHPLRLPSQASQPEDQKASMKDRKKMSVEPNEYSKSGTDSETASNEDAAFGTDNPKPEDAKAKAGEGNKVNPLDGSPANPEISQGTREEKGGPEKVQ